jgi:hypothetical protein
MNFAVQNIFSKNNQIQNENRQLLFIVVIFMFAPFVTFIYALFTYRNRNSQIIIVLFTALFGFNMIAENDSMDLSRNHEILFKYSQFSFLEILKSYFQTMFHTQYSSFSKNDDITSSSPDLYVGFIAVIVSRFTTNAKVLMSVFGLIYGYVFVKSMQKFIKIQPNSYLSSIPVLCAAFMMPLAQLAGIRYCTATYLFFWGVISIFNNNNNNNNNHKYYILLLLACLTHFSFIIPTCLFVVFQLFSANLSETKIRIAFLIFIVSFFFPDLIRSLSTNSFFQNLLGAGLQNKSNEYTNGEINTEMSIDFYSTAAWYIVYPYKVALWFVYGVVFVKYIPRHKIKHSIKSDKILVWVLVLLSFSKFSMSVSNLGGRLLMVSAVFFFYYLLCIYNENSDQPIIKKLVLISIFFIVLKIILETRFILEYTTPIFFYGSVFHIINDNATMSLWTNISDFLFNLSHREA